MSYSPTSPEPPLPDPVEFDVVFRGYDRHQVMELVSEAMGSVTALEGGNPDAVTLTARELRENADALDVVLRGYKIDQVKEVVGVLHQRLGGGSPSLDPRREAIELDIVLRGYDRQQVEEVVNEAVASVDAVKRGGPGAATLTAQDLRTRAAGFDVVFRGYDEGQVASLIDGLADRLDGGSHPPNQH
ncbi:hypothetical protein CDO52_04290 [Nocardiopsis gilva YIM 90087]|uniref:DivIVA domain-containing protein n=1 Tax=Nocardiopsis gilva YIM 90087 TaxID=1235441 RepID=A0A223S1V2_9ACTN|nr:DivIVA domain-containing protein [Nocardiopsis gilva]ASU82106.1 hypothetical protein CDO52_04290 [Nocardiopsis gilva YIM 90087]